MSIPIPIILALLSQKNNKSGGQMKSNVSHNTTLVKTTQQPRPKINRIQHNKNMATKISSVAQLLGGARGAKLGNVARIMDTVNSINGPMNAMSLLSKGKSSSPLQNILPSISSKNASGAGNIYKNINSLLSNMDKNKKDELLSMAQSIMNPSER